jgi:hypothetical protein
MCDLFFAVAFPTVQLNAVEFRYILLAWVNQGLLNELLSCQ